MRGPFLLDKFPIVFPEHPLHCWSQSLLSLLVTMIDVADFSRRHLPDGDHTIFFIMVVTPRREGNEASIWGPLQQIGEFSTNLIGSSIVPRGHFSEYESVKITRMSKQMPIGRPGQIAHPFIPFKMGQAEEKSTCGSLPHLDAEISPRASRGNVPRGNPLSIGRPSETTDPTDRLEWLVADEPTRSELVDFDTLACERGKKTTVG